MSAPQTAAMQRGRQETRAINDYLQLLVKVRHRTDLQRVHDAIRRRLAVIERTPPSTDPLIDLRLIQERRNLLDELHLLDGRTGLIALERAFVRFAAAYSARHEISYRRWRELGVPASVLKRAGVRP